MRTALLKALTLKCNNTAYRPVMNAIDLLQRYLEQPLKEGAFSNSDLFSGKDGDLTGANKESQEVPMLARHLLQSSLVHVDLARSFSRFWPIRSGRTRSPRRTGGGCLRRSGPI
ncbi:hypothetical protein [Tomitella fengzijianii]|uniref:Uncharacterized protein n=1 Tax=Tomitella fengzijianii TaxID=2597660 RepID=A0A516X1E3_9ACTN|nr:hypothetical protein [Tomitella fengzijianii]QDQ96904.1 hypothetical protein FO059_05605 [Tomitella fengzijianii]